MVVSRTHRQGANLMRCPHRPREVGDHVSMRQAALLPLVHVEGIVSFDTLARWAEVTSNQVSIDCLPDHFEHSWNGVD
jgi:hypothetical protein